MLFRSILQIDLRLDDFCEVWAGDQPVIDEYLAFREQTGIQADAQGNHWIYGRVELPAGRGIEGISDLRFGREWKIDGFELLDEASGPPAARSPSE